MREPGYRKQKEKVKQQYYVLVGGKKGQQNKQLNPSVLPLARVCIAQALTTSSCSNLLRKGAVLSPEMELLQNLRLLLTLFTGVNSAASVYFTLFPCKQSFTSQKAFVFPWKENRI